MASQNPQEGPSSSQVDPRAVARPLPRGSTPLPTLALALLAAATAGCGAGSDGPRGPFRLVDLVDTAAIESALEPDGSAERDASTLFDGPLTDADAARRFVHEGPWVGPVVLRSEAGGVGVLEAALVAVEPGRTIRLRSRTATSGEQGTPFALELGEEPTAEQLADPAWIELVFREIGSFQRSLVPVDASAEEVVLEAVFEPHPATRCVLLGRVVEAGVEAAAARYELVQFDERGGWLLASRLPGRSGHVRSVRADRETREALVLGVPGAARFKLTLPGGRARLTAAVTPLFASDDEQLSLTVEVRAGRRDAGERKALRGGERWWAPIDLGLEHMAGDEVEVVLTAAAEGGGASDALLAVGAPILEGSDAGERLDVVVISLDTMRADRMSAYGYDAPTTPTLAALADEAVVFENSISTAAWTLPAHVSLFSGQYPDRHRAFGQHSQVAADTPWLAEEFRGAGYVTAAFTGGGYVNPEFGFARGFDRYAFQDPAFPPPEWTRHRREVGLEEGSLDVGPARSRVEALELLRAPRRAPLFLFLHTYAAHNYAAGPEDLLAVGAAQGDLAELVEGLDTNVLNRTLRDLPEGEEAARLRARASLLYDASMRVADRMVADVLDALREADRLDDTLLVVLSDHGEELFERGKIGHGGSVYEELVRVPLLVRAPDLEPARVPDVVSLTDVAPTLLELCGLRAGEEDQHDGASLVTLLRGGSLGPRAVLARGDNRDLTARCLRSRDLKLLREERPGEAPRNQLFLLADDPGEASDRAAERPDDVETLEATLVERVQRLEALGPIGVDAEVSGEVLQNLRELGYIGD